MNGIWIGKERQRTIFSTETIEKEIEIPVENGDW
jgi:hypothetical protein